MSLKSDIFATVKPIANDLGIAFDYGTGVKAKYPYARYTLGSNDSDRLSNKKAIKNIWYQIDVFDLVPHDVEDDNILLAIELVLETNNLYTTDWIEDIDNENNTEFDIYHYFMEVRS